MLTCFACGAVASWTCGTKTEGIRDDRASFIRYPRKFDTRTLKRMSNGQIHRCLEKYTAGPSGHPFLGRRRIFVARLVGPILLSLPYFRSKSYEEHIVVRI